MVRGTRGKCGGWWHKESVNYRFQRRLAPSNPTLTVASWQVTPSCEMRPLPARRVGKSIGSQAEAIMGAPQTCFNDPAQSPRVAQESTNAEDGGGIGPDECQRHKAWRRQRLTPRLSSQALRARLGSFERRSPHQWVTAGQKPAKPATRRHDGALCPLEGPAPWHSAWRRGHVTTSWVRPRAP